MGGKERRRRKEPFKYDDGSLPGLNIHRAHLSLVLALTRRLSTIFWIQLARCRSQENPEDAGSCSGRSSLGGGGKTGCEADRGPHSLCAARKSAHYTGSAHEITEYKGERVSRKMNCSHERLAATFFPFSRGWKGQGGAKDLSSDLS
jgi:hypothetical protein